MPRPAPPLLRARVRFLSLAVSVVVAGAGCATMVEVPVETPVQSKIDVSRFRRVLVAGFVTDLGESDVELGSETSRLLQNQLRSNSRLQVLEPDHPPLQDALEQTLEKMGEGGKYTKQEKEQYKLETDRVLQDAEYWRKVGEEFQNPLIVTGRVGFDEQNALGEGHGAVLGAVHHEHRGDGSVGSQVGAGVGLRDPAGCLLQGLHPKQRGLR